MPVALTKNERFSYILEAERLCADRKAGACPLDQCGGKEADCHVIKEIELGKTVDGVAAGSGIRGYVRPDPSSQTVFILRSWVWAERAAILKMVQQQRPPIEYVELGLRFGLIGWENFKDANGTLIEFPEGKKADADKLEYINATTWGVELFNELFRMSYLEEAERKN